MNTPGHEQIALPHEIIGEGRPLIWGHGLSNSRRIEDTAPLIDWARVTEDAATKVVRYDARGHGDAPTTTDLAAFGWDALARDQLRLADSLGIDRYVAAGASMGCATALHAAVLEPERIEALVLVIPPTAWETRAGQTEQWAAVAGVVSSKGVEPMIQALPTLPRPDPFRDDATYLDRRAATLRGWDPERLAQVFRGAAGADFPSRSAIGQLTMPVLIMAWTGDPTHPVSTAEELAELLPASRLHLATTPADLAAWTDHLIGFLNAGR